MRWHYSHLRRHTAALRRRSQRMEAWMYTRAAGQGLVEYGLVLVLIMVVCVAILGLTGQTISELWYTKLIPAFD